jgi:hypothetical protein
VPEGVGVVNALSANALADPPTGQRVSGSGTRARGVAVVNGGKDFPHDRDRPGFGGSLYFDGSAGAVEWRRIEPTRVDSGRVDRFVADVAGE